jgi:hypothetical protein
LIITPTRGLKPPDLPVTTDCCRNSLGGYQSRQPAISNRHQRDVADLAERLPADTRVILLGSIATGKYVDVLCPMLGRRLHYPPSFIGRGDMSRGALLLRSVSSGIELEYEVVEAGARPRGTRPPKLSK